MNICAVRTLTQGENAEDYPMRAWPLPHEPDSAYRYWIPGGYPGVVGTGPLSIPFAKCKHCNCLYACEE